MYKILFYAVLVILFILLFALLFGWGWYYLFRKKYTRERFAFSLLFNYTSVIVLFLDYVLSWNVLINIINYFLTNFLQQTEIHFDKPGIAETLLAAIVLYFYYRITNRIYVNWEGCKSVEETENSFNDHNLNVFKGIYDYIKYPNSRIPSSPINKELENDIQFGTFENKDIAWHIQVAQLLKLTDSQYQYLVIF